MVAAGLLARKAVREGPDAPKPWVKTSLAPGSKVVTDYLNKAGLMDDLEALGFYLVGYGCTTCIGNSGPLPDEIAEAIDRPGLLGAVRQPQLRGPHPPGRAANYLARRRWWWPTRSPGNMTSTSPGAAGQGTRRRAGLPEGHRRLPENLVPDDAGLRFAFKEHRQEHSRAM
jgi:hypothetical protein